MNTEATATSEDKSQWIEDLDIPVELLDPNPDNPNEMTDQQFNMLVDNIESEGFVQRVYVRPNPQAPGRYRIIGGHHRVEVGKLLGYKTIPCTVNRDPNYDEDREKFQMVRQNIIHGSMSAQKFLNLYQSLGDKYSEQAAAELFGFTSEEEFKKLIKSTQKSLPPELQAEFKEASKELKTIDDLAKLLNSLFAKFGDTLPYNYALFDYGGKQCVWIRLEGKGFKNMMRLGARCKEERKALDHLLQGLVNLIAEGNHEVINAIVKEILDDAPIVKVKDDAALPTLDFLDS